MDGSKPQFDDEIDLVEFFETLWDGKWLISAFVAIAVLLGGGYILLTDTVYQTKIFFYDNNSIPFNKKQNKLKPFQQSVYIDFQTKLYTEKIFDDWKESQRQIPWGNFQIDSLSRTKEQSPKEGGNSLKTVCQTDVFLKRSQPFHLGCCFPWQYRESVGYP